MVVSSDRAQGAEKLWRLKIALESAENPNPVHYTKLLQDHSYRSEICVQASQSSNAVIRQLGSELMRMDSSNSPHANHALAQALSMNDSRLNRDVIETLLHRQQIQPTEPARKGKATLAMKRVAIVLVIGAIMLLGYFYGDAARSWLARESTVQGAQVGEQHWTADRTWVLQGVVFFEPGARLHIDAGTKIIGTPGSALVITRGAQIFARGSAKAPIVFTSAQAVGHRQRGDWGGVVMLGSAPVNKSEARIEGIPTDNPFGRFGGNDVTSACGVLEYVRIEYAGFEALKDNELNGLTLGGCGSDTLIRNIQVHRSLDDGIEIFGGSVDLKNIVISGAADDSLDWDLGWTGDVQFLVAQLYADVGDNAFEGDNLQSAPDANPRSRPLMYNVTLIGPDITTRYQRGMSLRNGTAGEFHNMIVTGFANGTIDVQGAETVKNIRDQTLVFSDLLIQSQRAGTKEVWFEDESKENDDNGFDETQYFQDPQQHVLWQTAAVLPDDANNVLNPAYSPRVTAADGKSTSHIPDGEFWDRSADYLGAVRPGSEHAWWQGWTDFPMN